MIRKRPRFFYGWVIIFLGFLMLILGYGIRYSFSVMFPSLLDQFGWPRDAAASILSLNLLLYGVTALLAGVLVDRVGVKKTMGVGAALLAIGTGTSGLGTELWHYYLSFGVLTGAGLALAGTVPFTRIVTNWFATRRGMALSLMFFGSGGAHFLYPLIALLIANYGLRGTFFIESAFVAAILLPAIVFLVRYKPPENAVFAEPNTPDSKTAAAEPENIIDHAWVSRDWTLRKAAGTIRLWALCFSAFAMWGVGEHILIGHQFAYTRDLGFTDVYAASVLALFGVLMSLGALAGLVSDRIGREATFTIGTVIAIAGIFMFLQIRGPGDSSLLYLYAILFGLGIGLTIPTVPAAATDIFQGRKAGAIIGSVWLAFSLGGTVGPWLGGAIFEKTGGYHNSFVVAIAMLALACIAFWIASPRKVRTVAGKSRRAPAENRTSS